MDIQTFWQAACEACELEAGATVPVRRQIGRSREMIDQLLGLVTSGQKTGTFALADDLRATGQYPSPGDLLILDDYDKNPRCLLRFDTCEEIPMDEIGPEHVACEGPGARDITTWRKIHEGYWGPMLEARGETLRDDIPVLYQTFSVLFTA